MHYCVKYDRLTIILCTNTYTRHGGVLQAERACNRCETTIYQEDELGTLAAMVFFALLLETT